MKRNNMRINESAIRNAVKNSIRKVLRENEKDYDIYYPNPEVVHYRNILDNGDLSMLRCLIKQLEDLRKKKYIENEQVYLENAITNLNKLVDSCEKYSDFAYK